MTDRPKIEGSAACAHLHVEYKKVRVNQNSFSYSDKWYCRDCKIEFHPKAMTTEREAPKTEAERELAVVTGERDRQYEYNIEQIAQIAELKQQLAASQERERQLRDALEKITIAYAGCYPPEGEIISPSVREAASRSTQHGGEMKKQLVPVQQSV